MREPGAIDGKLCILPVGDFANVRHYSQRGKLKRRKATHGGFSAFLKGECIIEQVGW